MGALAKLFDIRTMYLTLLALVEIIGDFSYEKYVQTGGKRFFGIGTASYIGVVYFLLKALKGSSILYINNMWDGVSSIIETLAAFFILGERFVYKRQYVGVLCIVAGMFLLHS